MGHGIDGHHNFFTRSILWRRSCGHLRIRFDKHPNSFDLDGCRDTYKAFVKETFAAKDVQLHDGRFVNPFRSTGNNFLILPVTFPCKQDRTNE